MRILFVPVKRRHVNASLRSGIIQVKDAVRTRSGTIQVRGAVRTRRRQKWMWNNGL